MKFKKLSVALAGLLCFGCFAACGGDPGDDPEPGTPENPATIDLTEEASRPLRDASEVDWLDYDEKYLSYPFYSDLQDEVTYAANAIYDKYGYIDDPAGEAVMWFGTEPAWYEWMGVITGFHNNEARKNQLRNYIVDRPIRADGFIWNWYDSPHWPTQNSATELEGKDHYHYDSLFRYINGVWEVMKWENSTDLLDQVDNHLVEIAAEDQKEHIAEDASVGKTVRQKLDMCMNYILEDLDGKNGLVILGEDVNNGMNLGRIGDYGSNYWDNFLFGYLDAYENMLFYSALNSMQQIELMCGNEAEAQYYASLAETVKTKFNETFWSDDTHRYIATIDIDGNKYDFGMTFLNMEAIYYGLADERQEDLIYTWIIGNRSVKGDRSSGDDIYYFKIAPRVTTAAIEDGPSKEVDGRLQYWYFDWYGAADVTGSHSYGQHFQNGGTIFYPEYYDLLDRIKVIGPESALNRWKTLAEEYAVDELFRRPPNDYGWTDMIGITNEFPESGLIPVSWVTGFMGINPGYDGLNIVPAIPSEYRYMGMKDFSYGGRLFDVTVYRNGNAEFNCKEGAGLDINLKDTAGTGKALVSIYNGDTLVTSWQVNAENGVFNVDLAERYSRTICRVVIDQTQEG